jgi:hypothetical protein
MEVSGQRHIPAALPREKSPRYSWDRSFGEHQSRPGRYGEMKILDYTGTRTPNPSVVQHVARQKSQPTTLHHPVL